MTIFQTVQKALALSYPRNFGVSFIQEVLNEVVRSPSSSKEEKKMREEQKKDAIALGLARGGLLSRSEFDVSLLSAFDLSMFEAFLDELTEIADDIDRTRVFDTIFTEMVLPLDEYFVATGALPANTAEALEVIKETSATLGLLQREQAVEKLLEFCGRERIGTSAVALKLLVDFDEPVEAGWQFSYGGDISQEYLESKLDGLLKRLRLLSSEPQLLKGECRLQGRALIALSSALGGLYTAQFYEGESGFFTHSDYLSRKQLLDDAIEKVQSL